MTDKKATTQKSQALVDYGPLIVFFIVYKLYDMKMALAALMVAITIAMVWAWRTTGHISGMHKLTFGIVMVSGTLTFAFDDPKFFYMKPTIVYALFTLILGVGLLRGKLFIRDMLSEIVSPEVPEALWRRITLQAITLFLAMMAVNEIVWRTVSEEIWVNVKIFGFSGVTILFTFAVIAQLFKYLPTEESADK
jgi:intracellular septation protein